MQGPFDPSLYGKVNYQEPLIKTGDILGITVYSDNPAASAIYNQAAQAPATPGALANTANNGYLVDNNGDILFHSLGKIHEFGDQSISCFLFTKVRRHIGSWKL